LQLLFYKDESILLKDENANYLQFLKQFPVFLGVFAGNAQKLENTSFAFCEGEGAGGTKVIAQFG